MKSHAAVSAEWKSTLFCLLLALPNLAAPAQTRRGTVAVLIQQSPELAGGVTIGSGVFKFEPGALITLTARPQPGYEFVYWMGEVETDPADQTARVVADKPKIIVALFEPYRFKVPAAIEPETEVDWLGGGAGLVARTPDYARTGFSGGGSRDDEPPRAKKFIIPEPATGLMLLGGFLALYRRRRRRKA